MGLDLAGRIPRFFQSIWPGAARPDDVAWVRNILSDKEMRHFTAMSNADQRHAVRVARRVEETYVQSEHDVPVEIALAAAILHDVGKNEARLGTYGRVVATVSGAVAGLDFAEAWQETSGFTRKVGLYLRYNIIGEELLEIAGSDPLVIAWSVEHHLAEDAWTVPVEFGRILAAADE